MKRVHRSVAVRDLVCVVGNLYLEIDGYFTKSFDAGVLRLDILQTNTVQKPMNSLAAYRYLNNGTSTHRQIIGLIPIRRTLNRKISEGPRVSRTCQTPATPGTAPRFAILSAY
ncbi:hypothetical protein [Roseovarius nanhaiticus]|uniref:hypothetical protein n=1 Tax=Roseovarius nanhaiticus TaxID=573024 RepID=UPI0031EE1EE3